MANTTLQNLSDYFSDARTLLLDKTAPYRYDDTSLLVSINTALLEGARMRPDLFIFTGDGSVPSFTSTTPDTAIDIDAQFRLAFLYGMVSHALRRDEEDVQDERANTFDTAFHDILIGVKPTPIAGGTPQPRGAK